LCYFQVILNGSPALASLQMMLWTLTTLSIGLVCLICAGSVWSGLEGTREVDSLLAAGEPFDGESG